MKKLLLAFFVFNFYSAIAQLQQAEFAIGGQYTDFATGIVQTADGGYAIAGSTANYVGSVSGINTYLLKLDSTGKVEWTKIYPGYECHGITLVNNKKLDVQELVIFGDFSDSGNSAALVMCFDITGNLIWNTELSSNNFQPEAFAATILKSGNIVVVGGQYSEATWADYGDDVDDTLLDDGLNGLNMYSFNISTGNMLWSGTLIDTISTYNLFFADGIAPTKDGGFLIAGGIGSILWGSLGRYEAKNSSGMLLKADSLGNFQWAKEYKGTDSVGTSIVQTNDEGVVITGMTYDHHIYIEKLDSTYNVQWEKVINNNDSARSTSIIQTYDGGYAVTGYTNAWGGGIKKMYVARIDPSGNLLWDRIIGGADNDGGISIIQTLWPTAKGYAIVGFTHSFGVQADTGNMYFVKLDTLGYSCNSVNGRGKIINGSNVISNVKLKDTLSFTSSSWESLTSADSVVIICETYTGFNNIMMPTNEINVFPNPGNGVFTMQVEDSYQSLVNKRIEVYNVLGELVYNQLLQQTQGNYRIDLSDNISGIYFYRIITETGKLVSDGKLIIQR